MAGPDDREELHRLREENLRLREERLKAQTRRISSDPPPTIHVKQTNESCLSGCGGLLGLVFLVMMFITQCTGK